MRADRIVTGAAGAAGVLLLGRLGGPALQVPLGSVTGLGDWATACDPAVLAAGALRLAGQMACGYLLLATVIQVAADVFDYPWLTILARRVLPLALRHAASGGAGLGLAAGSVFWSSTAPVGAGPRPGVELVADDEASPEASSEASPGAPSVTMTLLDAGPGPEASPATASATMRLLDPVPSSTSTGTTTAGDHEVWVVSAGDSFWSIAEDVVGRGRRTRAYWDQLIAANRDRLAVSDQPDLLFPGQRLTLPPPAS